LDSRRKEKATSAGGSGKEHVGRYSVTFSESEQRSLAGFVADNCCASLISTRKNFSTWALHWQYIFVRKPCTEQFSC